MSDIRRKIEKVLCRELNARIAPVQAVPADTDAEVLTPFVAVVMAEAEELLSRRRLWQCRGAVILVSHIDDTGSQAHSEQLDALKIALDEVIRAAIGWHGDEDVRIHGVDLGRMTEDESSENQAHADRLVITVGASG